MPHIGVKVLTSFEQFPQPLNLDFCPAQSVDPLRRKPMPLDRCTALLHDRWNVNIVTRHLLSEVDAEGGAWICVRVQVRVRDHGWVEHCVKCTRSNGRA
jgi:hypothetical protein